MPSSYTVNIINSNNQIKFSGVIVVDISVDPNVIINFYDYSQSLGSSLYKDILMSPNFNYASNTFDTNLLQYSSVTSANGAIRSGVNIYATGNSFFQSLFHPSYNVGGATLSIFQQNNSYNSRIELFTVDSDGYPDSPFITNDNYTFTFSQLPSDLSCFNEGTKILCLNNEYHEEYIEIEKLKKGNLVKTYKSGYRKILDIGKNVMINDINNWEKSMFIMRKNNENKLIDDLIITGWHSILVDQLGIYENKNTKRLGEIKKIKDKYLLLSSV